MKKLLTILLATLLLTACSSGNQQTMSESTVTNPTQDNYSPPQNGLLKPEQIEMLLRVKAHELALATRKFTQSSNLADQEGATILNSGRTLQNYIDVIKGNDNQIRELNLSKIAAQDLDYNPQEFEWVAKTVTENFLLYWEDSTTTNIINDYQQQLTQLKSEKQQKEISAELLLIEQRIMMISQSIKKLQQNRGSLTENIIDNVKLLTPYHSQINELNRKLSLLRQKSSQQ